MATKQLNVLQIRSEFRDNGPGTQSLEIAKEMRRRGFNILFASSGGVLAEEISKEFEHITIPTLNIKKRDLFSTLKNIIEIRNILIKKDIDVVHGHNAAATYCAYLASKTIGKKIKITHSVRGMEIRDKYQWRNLIYRLYPATFFAVSGFTKNMLMNAGVKEKNIVVTYNGVDLVKFDCNKYDRRSFRDEIGIDEDMILIGCVGAFAENLSKGQDVLIKSIPLIKEKINKFKIALIGDGPGLSKCKKIVEEYQLHDYVYFAGFRRDIPNIQAGLDVFVLASVWGEMFPNAILEAMAMGNPWVASSLSGIPEISEDGKNGLLAVPGSEVDLANKIIELVSQKSRIAEISNNCRKTILEKYTIAKVCDKIENGYLT
jgi:glycosyltransferase involved in cell wall biosynthesis